MSLRRFAPEWKNLDSTFLLTGIFLTGQKVDLLYETLAPLLVFHRLAVSRSGTSADHEKVAMKTINNAAARYRGSINSFEEQQVQNADNGDSFHVLTLPRRYQNIHVHPQ